MRFLLNKDLLVTIEDENLKEITNDNNDIVLECEERAIETVKEYLRGRYDIDYELRSYQTYTTFSDYTDLVRVRVIKNSDHDSFGTNWNIQLIDYNLSDTDEYILVKKINTCPQLTLSNPIPTLYQGVENYSTVSNPDYSDSCGIIEGFSTGKIINYYNSYYSSSGITLIDFSITNPSTIIGDLTYFDNYRLENQSIDFSADDRNPTLKTLILDLLKYELFQRVASRQISQIVVDRHDLAIDRLEKASKGIIQMNLKEIVGTSEFQNNTSFRFGTSESAKRYRY